jgi:methionyl-tRNA formyltransferase
MKIVFMGTPEFASAILGRLIESRHEILAVVTGRDKPVGRKRVLTPTAVCRLAERHSLPVLMPKTLKSEKLYESLRALETDLFVVAAFRILPPRLFELPRLGAINIHASLLPKYRGAAPINWALINGETETGLTSFFLKKTIDTGDVILQERTAIADTDTFDSLYDRLAEMAGPFCLKTLDLIADGAFRPTVQDAAEATPAPKIQPADAAIDFGRTAHEVANFIRGMATKPGAFTYFRGQKLKLHMALPYQDTIDADGKPPGRIVPHRKKLLVACSEGVIEVTRLVPAGKKEMDGVSFLNGFKPRDGESFEKS